MKKTILLTMLTSLITTSSWGAVVKGYDAQKSCDLYRAVPADSNGQINIKSGEVIINQKEIYGFSLQNMEVDFNNREVLVQPIIHIVFGLDRPLIEGKAIITDENPEFDFLINQLNRRLNLFEKICISHKKIVYAKMAETEEVK